MYNVSASDSCVIIFVKKLHLDLLHLLLSLEQTILYKVQFHAKCFTKINGDIFSKNFC